MLTRGQSRQWSSKLLDSEPMVKMTQPPTSSLCSSCLPGPQAKVVSLSNALLNRAENQIQTTQPLSQLNSSTNRPLCQQLWANVFSCSQHWKFFLGSIKDRQSPLKMTSLSLFMLSECPPTSKIPGFWVLMSGSLSRYARLWVMARPLSPGGSC